MQIELNLNQLLKFDSNRSNSIPFNQLNSNLIEIKNLMQTGTKGIKNMLVSMVLKYKTLMLLFQGFFFFFFLILFKKLLV
jgi:hypothetical protein